jgi:hypothetical protein
VSHSIPIALFKNLPQSILHSCIKRTMKPVEIVLRRGGEDKGKRQRK